MPDRTHSLLLVADAPAFMSLELASFELISLIKLLRIKFRYEPKRLKTAGAGF